MKRVLLAQLAILVIAFAVHACTSASLAREAPAPSAGRAFMRPVGTGPAFWGPGDLYTFLATGEDTGGGYFQLEALVPPGGGPPPHIHHAEAESFYLAQGELEMRLGERTVTVRVGDFVNVPRDTVHAFKNVGSEPARMIVTFVPAGFERYFEEVFTRTEDRVSTPPPPTPELIQRMTEAAPRHHCTLLPPPGG